MSDATIHQRMLAILKDLPPIGKDQRNAQQGFMFRGHDDVLNALNPLLSKHGVLVVPHVLERITDHRKTAKGSIMFEVNLHVRYTFYGAAGDSIETSTWGEGTDMGDKSTNKAMTMAFKNVLNQAFAISNKEVFDADADSPEETVARGSSESAGEVNGPATPPETGPEPSRSAATPGVAPSPAETPEQKKARWTQIWNGLGLAEAKAKIAEMGSPDALRLLLIIEGERPTPRKTLLAAISQRIHQLEPEVSGGGPQAEQPQPVSAAEESTPEPPSPPENGTLTSLKACLAFIAEQPLTVTNPDAWTVTGVLTGLHANGLGSYGDLEEVSGEALALVYGAVPQEVREMVEALGPEQLTTMAGKAK